MKTLLLGISLVIASGLHAQQIARSLTASTGLFIGYYEYKPVDYNADPSKKYPLIIFLHGIGERGNGTTELPRILANGIPKYINAGHDMNFTSLSGQNETFLVLSPQLSASYGSWPNVYVDEMLRYAKTNLRVDTNRIYLTGLSLGGGGVWSFVSASLSNARQFAAIAPVCGTCNWFNLCGTVAAANLPVWAFHAQDDGTVPASCTNNAINSINGCNPVVTPIKSIYPNGNHWIWDRSYDTVNNFHNPNVFEWFLGNAKNLPVNTPPVANAGADRTITLPLSSVTLSGTASTDADGTITRASWTMIQSPGGGWMQNTNTITATANNLSEGVYKFELTVVDNRALWSKDTVTITVNPTYANVPPVAAAGNDAIIADPAVTLDATSSYDPDGFISNYTWKQVGGPSTASLACTTCPNPVMSGLVTGTYSVELEVIDNLGAITKDTVYITEVNAVAPVDFLYIKGKNTGKTNILQWATANEFNNEGFEVERSTDGVTYTTLAFIKGGGTVLKQSEYSFSDLNAPQQLSYYRLKQIDFDREFRYSRVVTVNNTNSQASIEFYPNPVSTTVQLSLYSPLKGKMSIRILSLEGKVMKEVQMLKSTEELKMNMNVEMLPAGSYVVEMRIADVREMRKLVKVN